MDLMIQKRTARKIFLVSMLLVFFVIIPAVHAQVIRTEGTANTPYNSAADNPEIRE
jgi:hypothetical protein